MERRINSRLDMGHRALEFSNANPSTSPGYATAVKQLEEQLTLATQLAAEQRRGIGEVRTAAIKKERYRRMLRRSHLTHFAAVAERAAAEEPELAQKFDLPRLPTRGLAFRAAARVMIESAEERKELLSKYGLVEEVLQNARVTIDQLDKAAIDLAEGRRLHIGASASMEVVGSEVLRLVKILDGYNRVRFTNEANLMAAWVAASNIIGPPRAGGQPSEHSAGGSSGTSPEGGQATPAA